MDLNYFFNSMLVSKTNSLGVLDIVLTIVLPFLLTQFIVVFYKKTSHTGNYSQDFIYALLLFSSLTAVITLLIGSNIARAFGLVAALSLIRFRTALKSALDGIYLFWSLAVGMACGVGFYLAAFLIVFLGITLMWLAMYFRVGENRDQVVILKLRYKAGNETAYTLAANFIEKNVNGMDHINRLLNSRENWIEQVYSIKISKLSDPFAFKDDLLAIQGIESVEIFSSEMALFN